MTRARPLFKGHQQPRLPGELGYYDLRLPEVQEQQAQLAADHGIEGFCYWHYWFHGRRILERPFNEVLATGRPELPFCLAWANESWSRSWLGTKHDVILKQEYSPEDDVRHAQWLTTVFADPRNIRIHGRPLFLIYKPGELPDARRTTDTIRSESVRAGLPEPYLVGINAHTPHQDMRDLGFDMTEHHEPQFGALAEVWTQDRSLRGRWREFRGQSWRVIDYREARTRMTQQRPSHPCFPAFCVGWDNTPRRGTSAWILANSEPRLVGQQLEQLIGEVQQKPAEERIVFVNAWNEWAEGMMLEPDEIHGRKLLHEIRRIVHGRTDGTGSHE